MSTTETELIHRLYKALLLTKSDVERVGPAYGSQSVCAKALLDAREWLMEHGETDGRPKMIVLRRGERSVGK